MPAGGLCTDALIHRHMDNPTISKAELDRIHKLVPADYYSNGIERNFLQRYWHRRRFSLITQEFKRLQLTGNILDIGCHGGDLTNVMSQTTSCKLYGIDISPAAIAFAQKRFAHINFSVSDFPSVHAFESGFFSAVTAFDVVEHLPDTAAVLSEVKRLLAPKGYFIIAVPNENPLFRIVWWLWTKSRGQVWDGVHVHNFNREGLAIFGRYGFVPVVDKKIICDMWWFLVFRKQA